MANYELPDNDNLPIALTGEDSQNNPTNVLPAGATVAMTSSDETVLTVGPDPAQPNNPMAGLVTTTGKLGQNVQVNITVTNADGSQLKGQLLVDVIPSAAVKIDVQPGTPVQRQ